MRRVPVLGQGNRVVGVLTDVGVLQYAEMKPIEVCRSLGRIIASQEESRMDWMESFIPIGRMAWGQRRTSLALPHQSQP